VETQRTLSFNKLTYPGYIYFLPSVYMLLQVNMAQNRNFSLTLSKRLTISFFFFNSDQCLDADSWSQLWRKTDRHNRHKFLDPKHKILPKWIQRFSSYEIAPQHEYFVYLPRAGKFRLSSGLYMFRSNKYCEFSSRCVPKWMWVFMRNVSYGCPINTKTDLSNQNMSCLF
jgi:hypothetical protein